MRFRKKLGVLIIATVTSLAVYKMSRPLRTILMNRCIIEDETVKLSNRVTGGTEELIHISEIATIDVTIPPEYRLIDYAEVTFQKPRSGSVSITMSRRNLDEIQDAI